MTRTAGLDQNELDRVLAAHELVVSRAQAVACGMTRSALRYRIRPGGPWQQVLPGVYLAVTGTPTRIQKEVAAVLYAGPRSVLTGLSALRRHGMRVREESTISVLVPVGKARPSRAFVNVRPTTRMPRCVCYAGPVQYALPERAVADAARALGNFREVRALVADAVQQRQCRIEPLKDELAEGPVRSSAWLRRALAEVTGGIRSAAEGDFADLIRRRRLPAPMYNARLYAGKTFIAVADAWWPEAGVAAEVDSRAWHISPENWEHTMQRHARMSAHGIVVLHFSPHRIRADPVGVVAEIKAALAVGQERPRLAVRALPSAS